MIFLKRSLLMAITKIAYALGVSFLVGGMALGAFVQPVRAGSVLWDKSSLYFDEQYGCQGNCTEVRAKVCNGGDAMLGTTTFEVYYSSGGNPKPAPQGTGSKIGDGVIPAIPSTNPDSCVILTYPTNNVSGSYTFRALQRAGHPGQGDLWSGQCNISCSVAPTATATKTVVPSTATNTAVPPTPTSTNTAMPEITPFVPTSTNTAVPPTPTSTNTAVPEITPFVPTSTNTAVPPTPTSTNTAVPEITPFVPTSTNTAVPPTPTNTVTVPEITPVGPTATNTSVPPTTTKTTVPPTPTSTSAVSVTPVGTKVVPENTQVAPTNTPVVPQVSVTPGIIMTATKVVRQATLPPPAIVTSQPLIPVTGTDLLNPGNTLGMLQGTLTNLGMITLGFALVLNGLAIKSGKE